MEQYHSPKRAVQNDYRCLFYFQVFRTTQKLFSTRTMEIDLSKQTTALPTVAMTASVLPEQQNIARPVILDKLGNIYARGLVWTCPIRDKNGCFQALVTSQMDRKNVKQGTFCCSSCNTELIRLKQSLVCAAEQRRGLKLTGFLCMWFGTLCNTQRWNQRPIETNFPRFKADCILRVSLVFFKPNK